MIWPIIKYQVCGNDFIVLDGRQHRYDMDAHAIKRLADRHFGFGCDQVLWIGPHSEADHAYRVFNADGQEVMQCGNGAVALLAYVADEAKGMVTFAIGDRMLIGHPMHGISLGAVQLARQPSLGDADFYLGDVGNPHAILWFRKDLFAIDLSHWAKRVCDHLGASVNVSLLSESDGVVMARVFERGVGETLACGSAATVIGAAIMEREHKDTCEILMPGGKLVVKKMSEAYWLQGPVVKIGQGLWYHQD
jgi:diaminopimelate epimerase